MPTAIHQQQQYTNMMTPSYSTTNMIKSSNKTQQPTILKAIVISFEKRASDQKIWYTIRVEPFGQQKKYLIQKRFEDFSQFSQKLHERFSSTQQQNLAGSRSLLLLPPKIKNRSINLFSNNKQIHAQRVQELNQFLNALFHYKQSIVTDSFTVLEFFAKQQKSAATDLNVEKSNYLFINDEQQQQQYAASTTTMEEEDGSNMMVVDENTNTNNTIQSRWKRLRCTSFLAKQGQQQQSIPSSSTSNGLSSLCSQAANKIMPSTWHHRHNNISSVSPQASISTPANKSSATTTRLMTANKQQQQQQQQLKHVLKKSKSTLGIYNSSTNQPHPLDQLPPTPTTPTTPTTSSKTTVTYNQHQHQIKNTIKIKVIYDVDNIIVIQVPRSISLVDLRSRIAQKFSDPASSIQVQVKHDLVLLFHDNSSSCCSIATSNSTSTTGSSAEEQQQMILPAVLIQKEQDLKNIMNTKWNRLEKVTLRCIM